MSSVDLAALAQRIADELARRDTRVEGGFSRSGPAPRTPGDVPSSLPPPSSSRRPAPEPSRIADFIDHTLLRADATRPEIDRLCAEAREHRFAAVCVNPVWVPACAGLLRGSGVGIATVVGFPLGAGQPETKAFEASLAVRQGATEVDMVAAIGHVKSADWRHVADDIAAVVRASSGTLVKVIIESALLTPLEIVKVSALAREAGAQYVKTSTGFNPAGGATPEAVALMRLAVGDALGVKASGGVRDCETALRMMAAGATRIGTSSGVAMAQCFGAGPLPLGELLAAPHAHAASCATGSCAAPEPGPGTRHLPATTAPY